MVNERKWIIYMYTFPNGKRYIGKTSITLKDRQGGSNWSGYKNCSVLMKAVKKYGTENIKQEILFESFMTDEYAARLESICILLFKTNCLKFSNPSYGYNMTDGGEGTLGRPMSKESKVKMSNAKKLHCGDSANASKPLYCIELDTVFPNGVYAEKETGVSRKYISSAVHGRKKSTHGGNTGFDILHWIFASDKSETFINSVLNEPAIIFSNNNTSSGVHGVYFNKSQNKWTANIKYNRQYYFLGNYEDVNDAIVARLSAEYKYYGACAPQFELFAKYNIN